MPYVLKMPKQSLMATTYKDVTPCIGCLQEASFKYWPNKNEQVEYDKYTIETTSEDAVDGDVTKIKGL